MARPLIHAGLFLPSTRLFCCYIFLFQLMSEEEALRKKLDRLREQLEAAGRGVPGPAAPGSSSSGGGGGGGGSGKRR